MENFLQRNAVLVSWLSGLGIPAAIVAASWLITSSIESSKLNSEYVRIALSVLTTNEASKGESSTDKQLSDDEKALRHWAVRLLNSKSPEKFSEAEQAALLRTKDPFGRQTIQFEFGNQF